MKVLSAANSTCTRRHSLAGKVFGMYTGIVGLKSSQTFKLELKIYGEISPKNSTKVGKEQKWQFILYVSYIILVCRFQALKAQFIHILSI